MKQLTSLQKDFQTHLLQKQPAIMSRITGVTEDLVTKRLKIYSEGYRYRLLEALVNDYPTLNQYLGDDEFVAMGFAYIEANPSRYFSVNLFTQHLENFLATTEMYAQKPYLSELAGFVAKLGNTVIANDAALITVNDITAIPQEQWGDMVLSFHPSVCIHHAQWNVVAVWQALVQNQEPPAPVKQEMQTHCMLWRKGTNPFYSILAEQDVWIYNCIEQGKTFAEICDGLLKWFPEDQVAQYAVNLLLQWLNNEALSKVEIKLEA